MFLDDLVQELELSTIHQRTHLPIFTPVSTIALLTFSPYSSSDLLDAITSENIPGCVREVYILSSVYVKLVDYQLLLRVIAPHTQYYLILRKFVRYRQ